MRPTIGELRSVLDINWGWDWSEIKQFIIEEVGCHICGSAAQAPCFAETVEADESAPLFGLGLLGDLHEPRIAAFIANRKKLRKGTRVISPTQTTEVVVKHIWTIPSPANGRDVSDTLSQIVRAVGASDVVHDDTIKIVAKDDTLSFEVTVGKEEMTGHMSSGNFRAKPVS